MCGYFSTYTFVCFLGNNRARKACGAWTCPSWVRMKFFPDSCGRLALAKCARMGLSWLLEGQDMDLGLGRGRKDGRKKGRCFCWVVDVECAHPLMHAFVQSTAACTVSVRPGLCRLSGPVFCVRVFLLSGTETLLYSSTSARGRHRKAKLNFLGKTVQFLRFVHHSLLKEMCCFVAVLQILLELNLNVIK